MPSLYQTISDMKHDLALVFLHAFPLDNRMWSRPLELFSKRFRVVAPSFPGFGGRPAGPTDLDGFSRVVIDDLDKAGITRFIPIGLSMGGYVTFRLFEMAKDRIAAMVLADTRASADTQEVKERRTATIERIRREGTAFLADMLLPGLLGKTSFSHRSELVSRLRAWIENVEPEGACRALMAMRERPDSSSLLQQIHVPVLVIAGTEDTLTPPNEMRDMALKIPNSRFVELEGTGHLTALESPEGFSACLSSFFEDFSLQGHAGS